MRYIFVHPLLVCKLYYHYYIIIVRFGLSYLIIQYNPLNDCFVQHTLVPLLQTFRFGNFLLWRMAVKNVVITFTRGASPNVCHSVTGKKSKRIQVLQFHHKILQPAFAPFAFCTICTCCKCCILLHVISVYIAASNLPKRFHII